MPVNPSRVTAINRCSAMRFTVRCRGIAGTMTANRDGDQRVLSCEARRPLVSDQGRNGSTSKNAIHAPLVSFAVTP
jgi:hypothetical protein